MKCFRYYALAQNGVSITPINTDDARLFLHGLSHIHTTGDMPCHSFIADLRCRRFMPPLLRMPNARCRFISAMPVQA